jgi:O-antigen/teichoic acid export membrane protein
LGTHTLGFAWLMMVQGVSSFGIPEYLMREVGAYEDRPTKQVAHLLLLVLANDDEERPAGNER